METIVRKEWGSPFGKFQEFTPQEFVAACYPIETLSGGGWYIDLYSRGIHGKYDVPSLEQIWNGWTPGNDFTPGGEYQIDVYRWCHKSSNGHSNYNPNHTHLFGGNSVPTSPGETWDWYGQTYEGWNGYIEKNDPAGHFVLGATNATLKISASGNKAVIVGSFSPDVVGGSVVATNAAS